MCVMYGKYLQGALITGPNEVLCCNPGSSVMCPVNWKNSFSVDFESASITPHQILAGELSVRGKDKLNHILFWFYFVQAHQPPFEMSCQQNQQQCQPPPKCPSPKCPPKSPKQCLPPASSSCAPHPGVCSGPSSEGGCHLSHPRCRSNRCRRQSSGSCDSGSGQQSGGSECGHVSESC